MADILLGPSNFTDVPQVFVDAALSHLAIVIVVVSFMGVICIGGCALIFCCAGRRLDDI
jgi:hypothetical protein